MPTPQLRAIRWLTTAEGLSQVQRLATSQPIQPATVINLRRQFGNERTTALLDCAAVSNAAIEKLGTSNVLANDRALQQSTHHKIATYKASKFPQHTVIADLCCGIGGDAIALARRGCLIAIDRDPVISTFCAHNLSISRATQAAVSCQTADSWMDANQKRIGDIWLHIDPDRRPQGKRVAAPEHYEPAADLVAQWIRAAKGGAVKLAPAANIPDQWSNIQTRQWISHAGSCRQQIAWFDNTTQPSEIFQTKATMIDREGQPHSFAIKDSPADHDDKAVISDVPQSFLFDLDPAVRAAGLTAAFANKLQLQCLNSPAGFLTADQLPPQTAVDQQRTSLALLQSYHVLWSGNFDLKRIRTAIAQFAPRSLEIKVRGANYLPETLRPKLLTKKSKSNSGTDEITLLIGSGYAALARRIDPSA